MVELVSFGVIIDDIVSPDGETKMGVLGGGGPQTAFGMRMWSPSVGIVAGVGEDFISRVEEWLIASGINGSGLRVSENPTARAWQLLEHDERRRQVWRVPSGVIQTQLERSISYLPDAYRKAQGFHFGIHPDDPDQEFIESLHDLETVISVEPFKPADREPDRTALRAFLSKTDIFSANQLEAHSLIGGDEPLEQANRLVDAGANIVVLRLGRRGSLVLDGQTGVGFRVPAVPVEIRDPIGAGNAYCGGFLAGWVRSRDLKTAGIYGSVAASFLLEQVGIPVFSEELSSISRVRASSLQPLVEMTS
jgi:sugar/nucleoside kinase (ribokinase family)